MLIEKMIRTSVFVGAVLAVVECVSWMTASIPPCLIEITKEEKATYNNNQLDCPVFTVGSQILLGRFDYFMERHDKSIVASFTIVLAVSTIGLWLATNHLWRSTKDAATAAKAAAEHIPRVERAHVSGGATIEWEVTGQEFVPGVGTRPVTRPRWLVITVDNYGKTPAYVSHIAYSICPVTELPPPTDLPEDYERSKMLVNMSVKPGAEGALTKQRREFSEAAGKIVYGRFYYTDIFGDQHSSGFILLVMPSGDTVAYPAPPEFTSRS